MFTHRSASKVKANISSTKTHLIRGAFYLLPLLGLCAIPFAFGDNKGAAPSPKQSPAGIPCVTGWSTGPDLPSTGVRMVGVYFYFNSKFYAMGGRSMDGVGNDFTHPFEYDPASNTWTIKSATYPDNQVSNMACDLLTDGGTPYIYCVGGSAGGQTTATDRVFRYDPVSDTIEIVPSPWPGNADGITVPGGFTTYSNDKLYILGGFRINTAMTNQIWEFTPGTNVWVQKNAVLPVPRGYIPTTSAIAFSGIYTGGGSLWDGTTLQDSADSFAYVPESDAIFTIASIPRSTGEAPAVWMAVPETPGLMFVLGGGRTPPNPSNEVDTYDEPRNSWASGRPFVTPRRNFAADGDGYHIWLVGGYASDGVTPLSSMEIFCSGLGTPTPTPTATATTTSTPTLTPQPSPTPSPPFCDAAGSQPACNSTVFSQLTDFIVYISGFVGSLPPPSVFTVNGIPADTVSGGGSTLEFHFNVSPVISGQNTMNIPFAAFTCSNTGTPFEGFHCTFTYQPSRPTPTPRVAPTARVRPTPPPHP